MVVVNINTLEMILGKSKMKALLLDRNFERDIAELVDSIEKDELGYSGGLSFRDEINNTIKPSKIRIGIGIDPQGNYLLHLYAVNVQPIGRERTEDDQTYVDIVVPYGTIELSDEDWNRLSKLLIRYLQYALKKVKEYFSGDFYIRVDSLTNKKSNKYFKVEEISLELARALNKTIDEGIMKPYGVTVSIEVNVYKRGEDGNFSESGKYREKIDDCWKLIGVALRLLKVLKDKYRSSENIDKVDRLWKFGLILYNAAIKLYGDCKFKEYNIKPQEVRCE